MWSWELNSLVSYPTIPKSWSKILHSNWALFSWLFQIPIIKTITSANRNKTYQSGSIFDFFGHSIENSCLKSLAKNGLQVTDKSVIYSIINSYPPNVKVYMVYIWTTLKLKKSIFFCLYISQNGQKLKFWGTILTLLC